MDLIVLPDDGFDPVLSAIAAAATSVDVMIFRIDATEVETALVAAVRRGVAVRALIAHTNSGGERRLQQLENRLLAAGVTVSRTGDDLLRYHAKLLIVDRAVLHVFGFNYTALDAKSRSFGITCRDRRMVQEAIRLFDADVLRQPFEPSADSLVVSPENAREQLGSFVSGAQRQLLIYDPKLTDPQMIRRLTARAKAGVDVRVIGKVSRRAEHLIAQKCPGKRLHVRAIVRDADEAFVGSQSLRTRELDARREVGLLTRDVRVVTRIADIFEADWSRTERGKEQPQSDDFALADVAVV